MWHKKVGWTEWDWSKRISSPTQWLRPWGVTGPLMFSGFRCYSLNMVAPLKDHVLRAGAPVVLLLGGCENLMKGNSIIEGFPWRGIGAFWTFPFSLSLLVFMLAFLWVSLCVSSSWKKQCGSTMCFCHDGLSHHGPSFG